MRKATRIVAIFLASLGCGWSQTLQRQSLIGVEVRYENSGAIVQRVAPDGTAQAAGMAPGDILLRIGEIPITGPDQLSTAARKYRAGAIMQFTIRRSGTVVEKSATAKPLPLETSADADVIYGSVPVETALYRVIVTKPKVTGRHPAILLIGGLGCYSLDGLREGGGGYGRILYGLTRSGYVTMRVEKSGEGDSEGPACSSPQADLNLAVKRSIAGIAALRSYEFVDANRIFILAHSIGPVEGALVASKVPVQGFVAAETIGRSWIDYQTEIGRSQPLLLGTPYDQVESSARRGELCMHKFYIDKVAPDAIQKSNPECARYVPTQGDVPYTYFQQLADVDLAREWRTIDTPVLVIYGTSDPTTSADESRYLTNMINSFHPGRATYVEISGMSHHFDRQPMQADALRALRSGKDGEFESMVLKQIQDWLGRINRI